MKDGVYKMTDMGSEDYLATMIIQDSADASARSLEEVADIIEEWQRKARGEQASGDGAGAAPTSSSSYSSKATKATTAAEADGAPARGGEGSEAPPQQRQQQVKYCVECGVQLPAKAKFCSACGEKQPHIMSAL